MSTMIICAGKSMSPAVGRYDSAGFDAAIREAAMSVCPPYDGKRFNAEGKTVLIAEGRPALDTAEKILLPCEWSVDELLNEIPLRSFTDTERSFTERQWLKRAAALLTAERKWAKWLSFAIILIVPFSRMYLGVHTPMDVGVSYLVAGALVALLYFCFKDGASLEKRGRAVMAALIAVAAVYAIFVFCYNFPADIDPHNMASGTKNACTLGGTSLALVCIYFYDKRRLNFSTKAPLTGQILKYILGLALVVALKSGLKPVLNAVLGLFLEGALRDNLSNFLRYFLMSLFAGCVWPHSFPLFAKIGKR